MERIASGCAALAARADGLPITHGDAGKLAARAHGDGAAVLLGAGDPVWEAVVDGHVVDLRDRLIEPGTPRHVARVLRGRVATDHRALVARDDDRVRVVRRDPGLVVVVAARRSTEGDPGLAAVLRSRHGDVRDVDDIGVLRIDG